MREAFSKKLKLNEVKDIFVNDGAFAALKMEGSVATWGDRDYGGDASVVTCNRGDICSYFSVASDLKSGVKKVVPNKDSFAAIKSDGSVVLWGRSKRGRGYSRNICKDYGGSCSSYESISSRLVSNIKKTVSNGDAYAALKTDGSVVTWGSSEWGGESTVATWNSVDGKYDYSSMASELTKGIKDIISNEGAFAALKVDGSVVSWGKAPYGGGLSVATACADVGREPLSGTRFYEDGWPSYDAFKFCEMYPKGCTPFGISCIHSSVEYRLTEGVKEIFSNRYSFAALKTDGSVVTWGDAAYGGASSVAYCKHIIATAEDLNKSIISKNGLSNKEACTHLSIKPNLTRDVKKIVSNGHAFAALKIDGSVVTWGRKRGEPIPLFI